MRRTRAGDERKPTLAGGRPRDFLAPEVGERGGAAAATSHAATGRYHLHCHPGAFPLVGYTLTQENMAELNADDIPESEKERIVRQSGILEKLPPDFIPFDPTNATPFTRGGGAGGGVDGARIGAGNRPVEWVDSSDEESEDDYGYDEDGPEPTAESLMREQAAAEFPPLAAEFFDSFLYLVPFSFLYVLMDIMIHQQYAQHPTVLGEIGRLAQTVPSESLGFGFLM